MKKICLITGATAGIGEATAIKFAEAGYDLIITGRRKDRLDNLKADLETKYKISVLALNFDIRNKEEIKSKINDLPQEFRKINLLINNAGLAAGLDEFQNSSDDDWEQMIDTNIKGLIYMSKEVSKLMINQGFGHIINVGSIAGYNVYPKGHIYSGTKHFVKAVTESMRIDLLPYKIKVSSINPGMIETEFSEVRFKGDKRLAKAVYQGFKPLEAKDVAETIFFMASTPEHVNLSEVMILPTAQANATTTFREN